MIKAIALIDGNNFYASCEQVLDPSLLGRPVVVLSNNDGCIIARNAEARMLGISMGEPYFKIRFKLERLGVNIRSSNYELYADMSQRLFQLINTYCEKVEIYSIDEAFVEITHPYNDNLTAWSRELRSRIFQYIGITISIGIGKTKVQAKMANKISKKLSSQAGIFNLIEGSNINKWMELFTIKDIWGIGRKHILTLQRHGIHNAKQLRDIPNTEIKQLLGINGLRIKHELKGQVCLPVKINKIKKKETSVSRSFGQPIEILEELKKAIAAQTIIACEKLRKQEQLTSSITVFTRTSLYLPNFYSKTATKRLEVPSNNTIFLLDIAMKLTNQIYKSNCNLVKSGVIMKCLQSKDLVQLNIFNNTLLEKSHKDNLIKTIDKINRKYGKGTITWSICLTKQNWQQRDNRKSKASTTELKSIPTVWAK